MGIFDSGITSAWSNVPASQTGWSNNYGTSPPQSAIVGQATPNYRLNQPTNNPGLITEGVPGLFGGTVTGTPTLVQKGGQWSWEYSGSPYLSQHNTMGGDVQTLTGYDVPYSWYNQQSIQDSANVQRGYLNQSEGLINTNTRDHVNPLLSSYTGSQQQLSASGGINDWSNKIQDLVSGYTSANLVAGSDTTGLVNAYNTARGRFGAYNENDSLEGAKANFDPYTNLGSASAQELGNLSGVYGNDAQNASIQQILSSPLVTQQIEMGNKGIAQLASSSGLLRSGTLLKQIQEYGQTSASNAIAQKQSMLLSQAGVGNQAAQSVASLYQQRDIMAQTKAQGLSALDVSQQKEAADRYAESVKMQGEAAGVNASQQQLAFSADTNVQNANNTNNVQQQQAYLQQMLALLSDRSKVDSNAALMSGFQPMLAQLPVQGQ